MRSRNALQANDLLEIVDFIKNEEKYTARINELKAIEARLDEKLQVVNTLEEAQTMQEKAILIQDKLARDRTALEQEFEDEKERLYKEHNDRLIVVDKRLSELRKAKEEVILDKEQFKKDQEQLEAQEYKVKCLREDLDQRLSLLERQEFTWRNKINQLEAILSNA